MQCKPRQKFIYRYGYTDMHTEEDLVYIYTL